MQMNLVYTHPSYRDLVFIPQVLSKPVSRLFHGIHETNKLTPVTKENRAARGLLYRSGTPLRFGGATNIGRPCH